MWLYSQEDREVQPLQCLPLDQQDPDQESRSGKVSYGFKIFIKEIQRKEVTLTVPPFAPFGPWGPWQANRKRLMRGLSHRILINVRCERGTHRKSRRTRRTDGSSSTRNTLQEKKKTGILQVAKICLSKNWSKHAGRENQRTDMKTRAPESAKSPAKALVCQLGSTSTQTAMEV